MVKLTENNLRGRIRILFERCKKYEIEVNKLSETIREKKHARKKLMMEKRKRSDVSEFINWRRKWELRQLIKEKQKLTDKITKTKNKIPKWKLLLKHWNETSMERSEKWLLKKCQEKEKRYQVIKRDKVKVKGKDEIVQIQPIIRRRKTYSEMTDDEIINLCEDKDDRFLARKVVHKLRNYLIQKQESQGFDIDIDTYPGKFGGLTRLVPRREDQTALGYKVDYNWMSNFALSKYNARFKTNFQYVKLLKTNVIITGIMRSTFYITFIARDEMKILTFQAIVDCSVDFPKWVDPSCSLVRIKPGLTSESNTPQFVGKYRYLFE